jgi:hypothetical protein
MYLDHVQKLMNYSPLSPAFFLAVIDVFYFLFIAYLIRFFGILPTFGLNFELQRISKYL